MITTNAAYDDGGKARVLGSPDAGRVEEKPRGSTSARSSRKSATMRSSGSISQRRGTPVVIHSAIPSRRWEIRLHGGGAMTESGGSPTEQIDHALVVCIALSELDWQALRPLRGAYTVS